MATIGNLFVKIGADTKPMEKSLAEAKGRLGQWANSIGGIAMGAGGMLASVLPGDLGAGAARIIPRPTGPTSSTSLAKIGRMTIKLVRTAATASRSRAANTTWREEVKAKPAASDFKVISGRCVLGLALFTPLGLAGAVFYLVHNIIAKTNLFLVGGVMHRLARSFVLAALGGLYRSAPVLSGLFLISALSLAGLPPLSGFWAKLLLVQASLEVEAWVIAGAALAVGLLTLYSMTKIWTEGFWKPSPAPAGTAPLTSRERITLYGPIVAMCAITVAMGVWAGPFLDFAIRAADELFDPGRYLIAVLGARP